MTRRRWGNVALVAGVLLVLASAAWFYFSRCDALDRDSLVGLLRDSGPWALLVYAALYIVASPVPFVAPVLDVAAGLAFGLVPATLATLVVATLSAFVPFTLARRLGREWVEAKLRGRKLDAAYQRSGGQGGFLFVFLMRLAPVLPWEIQNYVAGLSKVSATTFALATVLGIIPGTTSLVWLGAAASDLGSWQFFAALGLNILTGLIPIGVIYFRRRRSRLEEDSSRSGSE